MKKIVTCGDGNPKGNVALKLKGGCSKELNIEDAYRCTGCGGWFHLDCILEHFKLERKHDVGRNELKEKIYKLLEESVYIDILTENYLKKIIKDL